MIRRTFVQLLSNIAIPRPKWHPTDVPGTPRITPRKSDLLPTGLSADQPEWLREWLEMPRLQVFEDDLPHHNDPHQRALSADILPRIQSGTPFVFRYQGGSEPGKIREVLPVLLFVTDNFILYQYSGKETYSALDPLASPIFLHAWCLARSAPRIFRLDRIQVDYPLRPILAAIPENDFI